MIYENTTPTNSLGGIGGTNIKPSNGSAISYVLANSGGAVPPGSLPMPRWVPPHPEPLPARTQNFTYGSQGWNPVNLTGLIAAAQQVFHFKRRNYVQGM